MNPRVGQGKQWTESILNQPLIPPPSGVPTDVLTRKSLWLASEQEKAFSRTTIPFFSLPREWSTLFFLRPDAGSCDTEDVAL